MNRKMGPLAFDHFLVVDKELCPACEKVFETGQFIRLIVLGPGDDSKEQQRAKGRWPLAVPIHWDCAEFIRGLFHQYRARQGEKP